uniref:Amine oxidase domain-containing protein n=1 Tax=Salix viminalis TaxID=40686 RepID=A0A6N2MNP7_SALVM
MVIDYFYNDYEDAEPPRVTSLKNTIPRYEFLDFGDQTYFLADSRGFESILIYIAKQFLSHKHEVIRDQRLKLNKVVREINYSKNGVQVKTEDGSMYQAKYVIVSVSVGVLQSDLIVFKPHLPEPVGRIYFCGEHTYSRYLGYADAAYFAGIETANHLIKCLKHEKYCNGHDRHSTKDRLNSEDPYDPDV